jgi:hypothetical protein
MTTTAPTTSKENNSKNNEKIQAIWDNASDVGTSPYLDKKQVGAHGIRFAGGNILVPLRDIHGHLQGVQCIDSEGQKRFLPGSQKQGHFHILGTLEGAGSLYFAEGYATAASIYEVTHCPVVVCFDVGNLSSVVAVFAQRYPNVYRIIAADNDWEKAENIGLKQAQKACALYECSLTYPRFSQQDANQGRSDFNDLMQAYGKEEVLRQLQIIESFDHVYPEVVPLFAQGQEFGDPFPVEALPTIIRDAVIEHQRYGKQAMPLVVVAALTQVSFAVQGLANVRRNPQLEGPISLNFAAIVPSGGGKTTADSAFSGAAKEWQQEKLQDYTKKFKAYENARALWQVERLGLEQKLKRAAPEKYGDLKGQLAYVLENEPKKPFNPFCLYTDVNQQSLAVALQDNRPSAALISDEAGLFIGSNGMRAEDCMGFFSFLNKLWEAGAYSRQRLTTANAHLVGRRFTCSLMMQPGVMQSLLRLGGGMGRDIGFLARMLITEPPSSAGSRVYEEPPSFCPAMHRFAQRIRACLDKPLPMDAFAEDQRLKPPVLDFSPQAKALWITHYNDVESQLKPYAHLSSIPDFARRSAEQAARLAGCFHVFTHDSHDEIAEGTMRQAITVAGWFLQETLRIFGNHDQPQEVLDAEALWAWCMHKDFETLTLSLISRYGPNPLRKHRERYRAAVNLLQGHGFLIKKDHAPEWIINPKTKT